MSYCRFSSDDFRSDIYCYESDAGYMTHVAGMRTAPVRRMPPRIPALPACLLVRAPIRRLLVRIYSWRLRRVFAIVDESPRVPIGGPHDGETFVDMTPGDCALRLIELRSAGYVVPQYAIDELIAEHADATP